MGETIRFDCPDGSAAQGYLAQAPASRSGVVVIQEWWGLNDQIRGTADRFAEAGFTALAPDLYGGRATQEPDEAGHMMEGLDWVGAAEIDIRGACRRLKQGCDRVGVTGFCLGGALTVIACARVAEFDAGVSFYGIPPREQADPASIEVPFQGHFANTDGWCTPALVTELENAMKGAAQPREIYRYDAEHAFVNEQSAAHDPAAAALAWERTLTFFRAHL